VNLEKFLSIYVIASKAKQSHFLQGVALAAFGNLAMTAFFFSSLYYPSSSNIYLFIYLFPFRNPHSKFRIRLIQYPVSGIQHHFA